MITNNAGQCQLNVQFDFVPVMSQQAINDNTRATGKGLGQMIARYSVPILSSTCSAGQHRFTKPTLAPKTTSAADTQVLKQKSFYKLLRVQRSQLHHSHQAECDRGVLATTHFPPKPNRVYRLWALGVSKPLAQSIHMSITALVVSCR